jgi:viroplasmin and RNaseH domain-containing protein
MDDEVAAANHFCKGLVNRLAEKPKFYVVWKGRKTGVYSSWEACAAQVQGFTGAQYPFPAALLPSKP